jgi:hypothetical protein
MAGAGSGVALVTDYFVSLVAERWIPIPLPPPGRQGPVSAQEALVRLSAQLLAARSISESCRRLREAAEWRETNRHARVARRASNAHVLEEACIALGSADTANLFIQLERLKAIHDLVAGRETLKRTLQVAADGFDEQVLRQERTDLDLDALPGSLTVNLEKPNLALL